MKLSIIKDLNKLLHVHIIKRSLLTFRQQSLRAMNSSYQDFSSERPFYCVEYPSPYLNCSGPLYYIHDDRPFLFLTLPGELRNKIYRMCLVGPSIYTLNLRFPPRRASSLLCVNKQVYHEAAPIFYAENVFRLPPMIFISNSLPVMFEGVCQIRQDTFRMMKRFILEIPIYGRLHDPQQVELVSFNLDQVLGFILRFNGDKLLIQLNYKLAWPVSFQPGPWATSVRLLRSFRQLVEAKKVQIEVNLEVPYQHLEASIDLLHQLYDRDWSIIVDRSRSLSSHQVILRDYALINFRDRYLETPGLREHYTAIIEKDTSNFVFRPARRGDGAVSLGGRLFAP